MKKKESKGVAQQCHENVCTDSPMDIESWRQKVTPRTQVMHMRYFHRST